MKQSATWRKSCFRKRSLPSGAWRHDAFNQSGPFLGDALYMGRALIALYAATGNRDWLDRAGSTADFIIDRCEPPQKDSAGVVTTAYSSANFGDPEPEFDENVAVARFANLLSRYEDNNPSYRKLAECAMHYLATPEIARKRRAYVGGLLLADAEVNSDPLHIVIVGGKSDAAAKKLFDAAVKYPVVYKQIEWQDKQEPPLHKDMTPTPILPYARRLHLHKWSLLHADFQERKTSPRALIICCNPAKAGPRTPLT